MYNLTDSISMAGLFVPLSQTWKRRPPDIGERLRLAICCLSWRVAVDQKRPNHIFSYA